MCLLLLTVFTGYTITSCSNDEEGFQTGYGYVQFRVLKSASYQQDNSRATVDKLSFLHDAYKIEVIMQREGSTIQQALVLNSYNEENAEFGLRSEKLQLLTGDYVIIGYNLYDNLDQKLYSGNISENNTIQITESGLNVYDILVDAVERGMASFKLVKNIITSRSGGDVSAYPLKKIKTIDITVKNLFTQELTTFKKVPVEYTEDFHDEGTPGSNKETSYSKCDTIVWLKAGTYQISSYTSYADKSGKVPLETAKVTSDAFTVKDNALTKEVEVPITLSETSDALKDYIALKEIWEALNGPNWSYYGEANAIGSNWNFNKDIDMWGDQPGIDLDDRGRVTTIYLAGFGAKGVIPDAIGQLTELQILSLGTHDEKLGGQIQKSLKANMTEAEKEKIRWDYDTRFLAKDGREGLSQELKDAINSDSKMKPIKNSRINLKTDVTTGVLTNGITGISRAFMRLTNLQQFFLANSPITDTFWKEVSPSSEFYNEKDSWSWSKMTHLTDVEIYNCPKLTKLPVEMISALPELTSLNIAHNATISAAQLKKDWESIIDGVAGPKVQLLYMGSNNLEEFPAYEKLNKMVKLSMLDIQKNKIKTLHPFGKEIHLVKCYLDYNEITSIPRAADGYFFGYNGETESFTCSYNKLTECPNIFNAKSNYTISTVDFSHNSITKFEDGDSFKGINASSVDLSYNNLETFPSILFSQGSPMTSLVLAGNGMKTIPAGSVMGKNSQMLTVLDLSYNKLSKLPKDDFLPSNLPALYGMDVSYNCFSEENIYIPLNIDHLNVYNVRHQRDSKGNRTLKLWPTGMYQCPSLVRFFIGSNDLRKIEDSYSSRLQVLEIADNPNISIDLSTLAAYISAGRCYLIYDKTQDVRGLN